MVQDIYRHKRAGDDPGILQVVAQILQDTAEVLLTPTLEEARRPLQTQTFQLVILDLNWPDGLGSDLLPLLHKVSGPLTRTVSSTPVMVFSAQDRGSEVCTAGIQTTLVKARTSNPDFLNTIRALVGGKGRCVLLQRGNPHLCCYAYGTLAGTATLTRQEADPGGLSCF
ncbi:MAG TPA: response regulator [Synechococcus sp. M44_DOE_062]|nr:response regulator [Synechococcus sp. M44_DOE_062]